MEASLRRCARLPRAKEIIAIVIVRGGSGGKEGEPLRERDPRPDMPWRGGQYCPPNPWERRSGGCDDVHPATGPLQSVTAPVRVLYIGLTIAH